MEVILRARPNHPAIMAMYKPGSRAYILQNGASPACTVLIASVAAEQTRASIQMLRFFI